MNFTTKVQYNLYLGLNVKGQPKYEYEQAEYQARDIITKYVKGCVMTRAHGVWQNEPIESTIVITIIDDFDIDFIIDLIKQDLTTTFEQDAVLVTKNIVMGGF